LAVGVYDWVVSFDHARNRAWVVAHGAAAEQTVQSLLGALRDPAPLLAPAKDQPVAIGSRRRPVENCEQVVSNFTRSEYELAVARVIEYVRAGDVFQVNLSQRLLTPLAEHPLDLYGRLRACNPAPFGAYFDLGDFAIASASPERFLALSPDGGISTRPIKGTRRRGFNPAEDFALRDDLQASEKDQAENLMIVDLLRNDLGRVCEYGSVRVERLFEPESYATVHHLVSEVRGQLRPGLGPIDLLRATFPGGSVTGAPKIRAMEIIAELERVARGPYCGSLGWIGFDGAMDTSILIRTMTCGRGWVQFPVGGGIVADSDPAREFEETLHKAEGMFRALKKD
jgi:para-aminobenzoate synthetase component 1